MNAPPPSGEARVHHRGGLVVVVWMLWLCVWAGVLYLFGGPTLDQRGPTYLFAILAVGATAVAVAFLPARRPHPAGVKRTGAPALAVAAAFAIGGIGWVFGLFMAYFAVPLLAFALARWRDEWKAGRRN